MRIVCRNLEGLGSAEKDECFGSASEVRVKEDSGRRGEKEGEN